jgi:hypothetical protein
METFGKGISEASGIEDFFKVAYSVSGFDQSLSAKAPDVASCYPKSADRLELSKKINAMFVKRVNEAVGAKWQKCFEKQLAINQEEALKEYERKGSYERSIDFNKMECPDD